MSLNAGFLKRSFALLIDLTVIIAVTWLLYLFPFNMIINSSIDKNYKTNVKNPYDEVTVKYSGKQSFFGAQEAGLYSNISTLYGTASSKDSTWNSGSSYISEAMLNEYVSYMNEAYSNASDIANSLVTKVALPYDENDTDESQFYSKIYSLYTYLDYSYAVKSNFAIDEAYEHYTTKSEKGTLNGDLTTITNEYNEQERTKYINTLELLIKLLNYYDSLNEGAGITTTIAYKQIATRFTNNSDKKVTDITGEFTADDENAIKTYLTNYKNYIDTVTTKDYLGTKTENSILQVHFTRESYYIFYYSLQSLEFNEKLPYYIPVYNHTTLAIVYALGGFILYYSIYTVLLRGQTLGRRSVKIKLVGNAEKDKTNPLLALLHDIPFKFLYLILLGMVSLAIAGIALLVFLIVDFIMIKFTKSHKCIRDILTATKVIEGGMY